METFRHPALVELYNYWNQLPRLGTMPLKSRFDVLELSVSVWPRLVLFEVLEGDPRRYRCRVHGTYLTRVLRRDLTGRHLVGDDTAPLSVSLLNTMRETHEPQYHRGPVRGHDADWFIPVEALLLPLCDDAGIWRFAIGAGDYSATAPLATPAEPTV